MKFYTIRSLSLKTLFVSRSIPTHKGDWGSAGTDKFAQNTAR